MGLIILGGLGIAAVIAIAMGGGPTVTRTPAGATPPPPRVPHPPLGTYIPPRPSGTAPAPLVAHPARPDAPPAPAPSYAATVVTPPAPLTTAQIVATSTSPTVLVAYAHSLIAALEAASPHVPDTDDLTHMINEFQTAYGHGLAVDGQYGPRTRYALSRALGVAEHTLPAVHNYH